MPIAGTVATSRTLPPNSFGGPFTLSDGFLYCVAASGVLSAIHRSKDNGVTWSNINSYGGVNSEINSIWAAPSDARIIILTQKADGSVQFLRFLPSISGSGTFEVSPTIQVATVTSAPRGACCLVRRSTGELVAFFQGPEYRTMGTGYSQIYWSRSSDNGATWTAGALVAEGGADVTTFTGPVATVRGDDSIGLFFRFSSYIANTVISNTNTFGVRNSLSIGANTASSLFSSAVAESSSGYGFAYVTDVRRMFAGSAGISTLNGLTSPLHFLDGGVTDYFTTHDRYVYRVHVASDGALYSQRTNTASLADNNYSTFKPAITGTYQRAHCNVYMKTNGDIVLGYIAYDSNNALYYGEELIEANRSAFARARFPVGTSIGGPFKVGTNLYAVFPGGLERKELNVYKSTDTGVTWTIVATTSVDAEIKTLTTHLDTSFSSPMLQIVVQAANGRVIYVPYQTAPTDVWYFQPPNEKQAVFTAASTAHTVWGCGITKRSNGEIVVAAMDSISGGTTYSSVSRLLAGTWTKHATAIVGVCRGLAADANSRVRLLTVSSLGDAYGATLLADNSIINAGSGVGGNGIGVITKYGADGYFYPKYLSGAGTLSLSGMNVLSDTITEYTETASTVVPEIISPILFAVAVANSTERHVLYIDDATQGLWHDKDTGSGWGTDAQLISGGIGDVVAQRVSNIDQAVTGNGGTNDRIAQSFSLSQSAYITQIEFRVYFITNGGARHAIEILDALGGNVLASGQTPILNGSQTTVDLQSSVTLSAGTYYLSIRKIDTGTGSNTFRASDANPYAGGSMWVRNSGVWTESPGVDLHFAIRDARIRSLSAQNYNSASKIGYIYDDEGVIKYGELGLVTTHDEIALQVTATTSVSQTDVQSSIEAGLSTSITSTVVTTDDITVAPTTATYRTTFSALGTPETRTDHHVRYRHSKDLAGGRQVDVVVSLWSAGVQIASWTHTNINELIAGYDRTLTDAQAESITSYNTLELQFEVTFSGELPRREYRVYWAAFAAPPAAAAVDSRPWVGTAGGRIWVGVGVQPSLTGKQYVGR